MSKKQTINTSPVLKSTPIDPPVLFPHRVIDLQLLKSIQSNFSFHKANADKIAAKSIRKFERALKLKSFTAQERRQFITETCNDLVDIIVLNDTRLELANFLDEKIRNSKLTIEIARLEKLSNEEYYQQILIDSENSGRGSFPPLADSSISNGSYVGLTFIWASKMYHDYLKDLLKKESTPEIKESLPPVKSKSLSINFHPDILSELHATLLPYFSPADNGTKLNKQFSDSLRDTLSGKDTARKLLFNGNGNVLTYVFKELYEHGLVLNSNKRSVAQWIVNNFQFRKGKENIPTNYKEKTVYNALTAGGRFIQVPKVPIDLSDILNNHKKT